MMVVEAMAAFTTSSVKSDNADDATTMSRLTDVVTMVSVVGTGVG
jgi:hypothetical protein